MTTGKMSRSVRIAPLFFAELISTVLELLESAEVSLEDKGEVLREWFQDSNGRTQALLSLTPQNIVLLLPLCDVVVQRQVLQRIPKERREILPDVLRGLHPGAFQSNWKHFDVDTLRGILSACNPLEAAVLLGLENKEQFRNWFAKVNAVDRVKLLKLAMPILKALPEELVLSDAEDTAGASEAPSLNSTLVKAEEILPSLTGDETREDASRVTASGPEAPPLEGRNLHPPPHGPLSFPKNSTFSYVEHGTNSSSTAHINKAGPRITGPPVFRPSPSATPSAHDEDPEDPDYAPGLSPSVEESATAGRRSLVSLHSKGSRSSTQASGSGRSVSKLPTQPRPHYRPYPSGLFVSEALQTRLPTQPGPFSSSPTENAPLISCTEK